MIRVYTASKLSTAPMWLKLQDKWNKTAFFHARWIRHVLIGTLDSPENAVRFWVEDEQDVETADILLVYAPIGQHLRGALVEAGMAIAKGVPVMVIGNHPDYGTWQYHPGVIRVDDFDAAYKKLMELDKG